MEKTKRVIKAIVEVLFTHIFIFACGLAAGGVSGYTIAWLLFGVSVGFGAGYIYRGIRDTEKRDEAKRDLRKAAQERKIMYTTYIVEHFRKAKLARPIRHFSVKIEDPPTLELMSGDVRVSVGINDYNTLYDACVAAERRWNSKATPIQGLEEIG